MKLAELLERHTVIGVAGNRSTGKTSLALTLLAQLREKYPHVNVAVLGVEPSLKGEVEKAGMQYLESKSDVLDLQLRDTVIYIAEMGILFDTSSRSKQLDKLMRFIDRLEHLNCKLLMDTAREGYYNKFMCARVTCFLVKKIEYDALVNGTWLKERTTNILNTNDYRLECDVDKYYIVSPFETAKQFYFPYMPQFDSKKGNKRLFSQPQSLRLKI